MLSRPFLVFAIFLVLGMHTGCASYQTRDEYAMKLANTPEVLGDISEQSFLTIEPDRWVKFELGGDTNVLDFGDGKSFFAAFELLPDSVPGQLEFRTKFNTIAQARGHVVIPSIIVLDADYSVIAKEESAMRQDHAPSGDTEFAHELSVRTGARYVVIHTDPDNVSRSIPWHYSLYVSTPVNVGTESNKSAKVGVGGPMRIKIAPTPE